MKLNKTLQGLSRDLSCSCFLVNSSNASKLDYFWSISLLHAFTYKSFPFLFCLNLQLKIYIHTNIRIGMFIFKIQFKHFGLFRSLPLSFLRCMLIGKMHCKAKIWVTSKHWTEIFQAFLLLASIFSLKIKISRHGFSPSKPPVAMLPILYFESMLNNSDGDQHHKIFIFQRLN